MLQVGGQSPCHFGGGVGSVSGAHCITTVQRGNMYISVAEKEKHSVLPGLIVINNSNVALSYYVFLLTPSDLRKEIFKY
jgi:hypothetical protein